MKTTEELLAIREKANIGPDKQISKLQGKISSLELKLANVKERAKVAETILAPTRESLNRMTAENSNYKRKLKRAGLWKN